MSGQYLAVTEYGSGGRQRFLIIPERHKAQGWTRSAFELTKVVGFLDMPYGKGNAPLPRWPFGGSTPYYVSSASMASMGKPCSMGGSASAQATSPAKVNKYRSFVVALKGGAASLQLTRDLLGFDTPFSLKQYDCMAGEGVCSRKDSILLGDSFYLRAFRETLVRLKWEVNQCFERVELGLGPWGLLVQVLGKIQRSRSCPLLNPTHMFLAFPRTPEPSPILNPTHLFLAFPKPLTQIQTQLLYCLLL